MSFSGNSITNSLQNSRTTFLIVFGCCIAVIIPFAIVDFPPITDLPQQSAQIRLFLETIHDDGGGPYRIQWFTPYSLSYLLLGGSWMVFGPHDAGRVGMALIGVLWILAFWWVARKRNRPESSAILAGVFFFNHIVYWGFYSFAVGWPIFLLWFQAVSDSDDERLSWKSFATFSTLGLLLYLSHVLWLLAGVAWFVLHGVCIRRSIRTLIHGIAYLGPLVIAVILWYPLLAGSTMATPPLWATDPLSRISFSWLADAALGGLEGNAEAIILVFCLVWLVLSARRTWSEFAAETDAEMLLCAGMFLVFALILPDKFMNTIRFGQRWVPPATILLLGAMPGPRYKPGYLRAAALAVLAGFAIYVASAWFAFERTELTGLRAALENLPQSPKTLGLSFPQKSEIVRGYPFIQMFAYSQVLKGGLLNFSFAEFSPCLVVYKTQFQRSWTGGLEWFPGRLRESDLEWFDHIIVNGPDRVHSLLMSKLPVQPVTKEGTWRLYRIN
ncbi:hypothetical protein [Desulfomonile tiedjei]|uniref:Glycosyltransferase RgtA/B/C/D-like domain-containing protein n=1 Tax=Desulfomonile tiedjei (strain ATCC 49306 / DSM 6799 / DCB-1) TaxID=706587 RepID=I4BZW4_DESTA|nr:hypothetical protein [Desulfomonile tiedjei]AFM22855.1 hypothetical protein Desti_0106 [Desulfomonile tiedjei DSM 6799]